MQLTSWVLLITYIILAALYINHLVSTANDVKICPKHYKVKRVYDGKFVYYTLHYFLESHFEILTLYMVAGEDKTDEMFGHTDFIEYKFNSVEDAERYYNEKYKATK